MYSEETLASVRTAVGAVKGVDGGSLATGVDLELDSIGRITLIAELENAFQMPIGDQEITPESFQTLESLSEFIESIR